MAFLSPLFLVGLLSAAIPLIIHLSRSRRTKKIRFSTTRFITDQFLRSYRMSRLKELWLLAARMALCALFAMALAQPYLKSNRHLALFRAQSRTVVFVLDNSASMGYRENDVSLMERAKSGAREVLDSLRKGDRASVVLAGRRAAGPDVLFDEPTTALGDVRQAIDSLAESDLGTDLSPAVVRAEQIVQAGSQNGRREIYLFSDLQEKGWQLLEQQRHQARSANTDIYFVSVRPKSPRNLAVTAIEYAASRPMAGIPFLIRPHIRHEGQQPADFEVELYVDDKKVGEQRIESVQPGRWSAPSFYYVFESGGWHTGYVKVNDDTLAADNRRHFSFQVLDSIHVLAVNGSASAVPRHDEMFFLKAALTAASSEKSPIRLDVTSPAAVADTDFTRYSLVILANVGSLAQQAAEKLEAYVDQGGSLLVFLGDKIDRASFNQTFTGTNRLHKGLLPGPLTTLHGNPSGEEFATRFGEVDGDHVVFAGFEHSALPASFANASLKAYWGFDPGDSAILMRSSSGEPLLCERSFGQGQVMLFAATCDRDWTDLPVRPAYLPWLYRLVGYLAQQPLGRQGFYHTGDSIPVPLSATKGLSQLLVRCPDGSTATPNMGTDSNAALTIDETEHSGIYTLYAPGKSTAEQRFVVNLEAYESDLTPLENIVADVDEQTTADVRRQRIEQGIKDNLLPGRPFVTYIDDPARIADMTFSSRSGWELVNAVLLLAIIVALLEPWFANRISVQRYFKTRHSPQRSAGIWSADTSNAPSDSNTSSDNGQTASMETVPAEQAAREVG